MNSIQVKNVVKKFGNSSKATAVLDGISLEIKSGSLFALLGYRMSYIICKKPLILLFYFHSQTIWVRKNHITVDNNWANET
jgi:hypothetical protein